MSETLFIALCDGQAALREKLPDRENLKATVMKERRRLELLVADGQAATAAAEGAAADVYAKWPGMLAVGSCHGVIQHVSRPTHAIHIHPLLVIP